mmetsp:Transcript_50570/g.99492  ORF Transcript_50570/g.99492 Transcript_50570/m.99492 type:complete len:140 (-) Transcript_50570:88-507(-)
MHSARQANVLRTAHLTIFCFACCAAGDERAPFDSRAESFSLPSLEEYTSSWEKCNFEAGCWSVKENKQASLWLTQLRTQTEEELQHTRVFLFNQSFGLYKKEEESQNVNHGVDFHSSSNLHHRRKRKPRRLEGQERTGI